MLREKLDETCSKLGISVDALKGVDVLVLPENIESVASCDDVLDSNDSMLLAKDLRERGVSCRTAYDLGWRPKYLDRRGGDVWLGVLWLLNEVAAPSIAGFLSQWLSDRMHSQRANAGVEKDETTTIHLELRLQDGKRTSCIKFDGSAADLDVVMTALQNRRLRSR